jgi:crotonobetainyl-CoA:carnitine CoA-transferase CaiB-like acyl-CoA transferase
MKTLEGIRVLELGQYIAGPYCGLLLAEQGAEVVKIERPGVGDPRRAYDPLVERNGSVVSGGFLSYNRNKESLALDIQHPAGQDVLRRLIREVDVVVENLRPGVMEKLGLSYETLRQENPRLVYCAISGFGRLDGFLGKYSARPAFDTGVQAMAGLMSLIGEEDDPPGYCPPGFADIYTGVFAALAISLALFARERSGAGTFIDQAMFDAIVSLIERPLMIHALTGQVPTRGTDHFSPVGVFRAADGYVAIILPTDEMWRRFCRAIDRLDLMEHPSLRTVLARAEHFDDLIRPEAELWTRLRSRAEIVEHLADHGVPAGEVRGVDEVFSCDQVEARRMLVEVDDQVAGPVRLARTPLLFSTYELAGSASAPRLGEHTSSVLRRLIGATDAELDHWCAVGAIGDANGPVGGA